MIQSLRAHPFRSALLGFLGYLIIIFSPRIISVFLTSSATEGGAASPSVQSSSGLEELPWQLGLAIFLILVVALLGRRREVGFRRMYPGGLKYVLIPAILFGLLFGLNIFTSISEGGRDVFMSASLTVVLGLVLLNLLIGFTEELMFRGILFEGLRTRLTSFWTVVVSALLFGSLHFQNLLYGASMGYTLLQVIFAAGFGIMLGALRLRIGSVVPLMLFHTVWDFLQTDMDILEASQGQTAISTPGSGFTFDPAALLSPELSLPLIYGVFMMWRYYVARRKGKVPKEAALNTQKLAAAPTAN